MGNEVRSIEVDAATARALEAEARDRGQTLPEFLAELARLLSGALPADIAAMREACAGAWSPAGLAEDAERAAAFERTREGAPFEEVAIWMRSWGAPDELPTPKPRKL